MRYSSRMDSIEDLLGKFSRKEPPEAALIKQYIEDTFHCPAVITVQESTIVITVQSAALANVLRLRTTALRTACATEKRFVFRIG
jgi:hypothetical protein